MYAKSKLIEKQISNHSYNELFRFFDFHPTKKTECHELLKMQVNGGYSSGHTRLITPKTGTDKCWFITSGIIIAIQKYKEKETVLLLFGAGDLAVLPETFFINQELHCILIACPDTHFIEISQHTIIQLQGLVPDPIAMTNKMTCAVYKNYREKVELMSMPGIDAILEFHDRYPQVKGPGKKIDMQDNHQASYLGMNEDTFCRLKKKIASFQTKVPQISITFNFFWETLAGIF